MWRDETPSWRIVSRVLKRRWPPAGRSRSRRRSRSDVSSRFWTSKSATWTTWDRTWRSSLTNSHSGSRAASPQSALVPPMSPWFVFYWITSRAEIKAIWRKTYRCLPSRICFFLRSVQANGRYQKTLKGAVCKIKYVTLILQPWYD